MERPVLIAGDDGVPVRVREELAGLGVETVSICSSRRVRAARSAGQAGARVVIGDVTAPETWQEAGLDEARSVGILGPEDLENLNVALLVADENTTVPIVTRLFGRDLAVGMEQLLGERGTVLSEIDVAGPALIQAALEGNEGQRVKAAGRVLEVDEVDKDDPAIVVTLCDPEHPTDVFPPAERLGEHVLALVDRKHADEWRPHRPTPRQRLRALLSTVPRRAWVLLATIVVVFTLSTLTFALSEHLEPIDAMYFTATTMATVGYGDVNLLDAPDWLKLFDIGLMAVSAVLLASVLAIATDILVSQRIDRALGRFPRPTQDHVIVCGLGKAGARVIAGLHDQGIPCIAVERNPEAVGVALARRLEIPVVFGDGRTPGVLSTLHILTARAVMALTSDDLVNLEFAIGARRYSPKVRILLRIFDPRLAERLDRGNEFDVTRSVSALAAPHFSAALIGRAPTQPLALSNVPLRVLETTIPENWPLANQPIERVHANADLRVLALDGDLTPEAGRALAPGLTVSIVGTREACDALLTR